MKGVYYFLVFYSFILLVSCKTEDKIVDTDILELIPSSQSINYRYNGERIYDESKINKDSIFLLSGNFYGKHTKEFIKTHSKFPNVLHLKLDINSHNVFMSKVKVDEVEVIKQAKTLDLTKFENLKAITISGYNYNVLKVVLDKISKLPQLQLLIFQLEQYPGLILDETKSINEVHKIPDNFCELNIETLKIYGKQEVIKTKSYNRSIPFYGSINLPECIKKSLKVSNLVYDLNKVYKQHNNKKNKRLYENYKPNFEQFLLHKKYKTFNDTKKLTIINNDGLYAGDKKDSKIYNEPITLYKNKRVGEVIEQHHNFIKQLLQIQSVEDIIIKNAFIDSIPEGIKHNKKLKKISIQGSYVSYMPESIGELSQLEVLKMKDISSSIYFHKTIKGLSNLKKLFLINVGMSNGFPNLLENKKLEELLYMGRQDVDTMPEFIGSQPSLKTLIWRYSNIKTVPKWLNSTRPKVVNLDNNKLEEIDAVVDMAKETTSFSYDINAVPYKKRQLYNKVIYPNGQLLETLEEKEALDSIFEIRKIPFNYKKRKNQKTVINKINWLKKYVSLNREALSKDGLFKAIKDKSIYKTISFKNTANASEEYRTFSNKDINELEYYLDIIEKYNIDPINFFKIKQYDRIKYTYKRYFPIDEFIDIDTLETYYNKYKGYEFLEYNNISKGTFDYGKLKHLRKGTAIGQEGVENVSKIKGIQHLEIKDIMNVNQIPECFCELKALDSLFVRDPKRELFSEIYPWIKNEKTRLGIEGIFKKVRESTGERNILEDIILQDNKESTRLLKRMKSFKDRTLFDYKHIDMPECIKQMQFKTVSYSGLKQK